MTLISFNIKLYLYLFAIIPKRMWLQEGIKVVQLVAQLWKLEISKLGHRGRTIGEPAKKSKIKEET